MMYVLEILVFLLLIMMAIAFIFWKEWRRTVTLFNIGLELSSTIQRKDLLQIIMKTAAKTMNAEGSSIILVDEERDELYFEVAIGEKNEEIREIRLKIGEGIAGWVAKTGESILIPDAAKDPRWSNRVSTKVNVPTRNMICVPVITNGKTLGVLQVINKKGNKSFNQRDLRLLEMIASPTAISLENMFLYEALVESLETLRKTTAAKERMESELQIAQDIQRSFLPGSSLQMGGVELFACLFPAKVVGGDFYHFIPLDDKKLLICLGDVSDKGMPAALFMSGLMIWIQAKANSYHTPAEILQEINREVSSEDSTMFATIFLAILDVQTGQLCYCDGGHCTPYIIGNHGVRALEGIKNLPIGIFEDGGYGDQEVRLEPGDSLVLYTDGITEAENDQGQWFTTNRLFQVLEGCTASTPRVVTELLREEVLGFANGHPQSDDIAIMVANFDGIRANFHSKQKM
ncbi:PP2C family protein-serine/threonine phosphatase [Ammoniphilus resinae]|uniref:Serine phosphatase RsbU (Regulator of sigma subunit)/putative methionine-R-sulfoxide reductase with GAF domain n=1 Tax=Ammoniphilus resinae TaxID=861532 RepID=A0ABS4GPT5_9BACL|nr:GAF domain-containing SpoIIE family protein phosphatase [Ammoniphilus resinae]MBP1932274.1 serine phosphatase RsbU (regulator of sigma subunit)/putative methionine-R-sulfoxide reductase with GAF domain [Ammoniphilus resinae]